ncbi:hypothetical protein SBDP1_830026 [Syntrophobacter sp. SbD1]|nr:hypothetical protein SBDP1_830026 [Syntrophobacter sp. SbD1]
MNSHTLYRGVWPQVVSKLAKYAVRFIEGAWKITVLYEAGEGLLFLAVEGGGADLVSRINAVKTAMGSQPGGAFYINEYKHVIVPVKSDGSSGTGSHYFYAGQFEGSLSFDFEGQQLTSKPVRPNGMQLSAGDRWVGPRPGIPYVLAAGGCDIYYETPALTDDDPPQIRPSMTRKVKLSKVLGDKHLVARAVRPIANLRGHTGGRFYVNEHGCIFTPVDAGDGNGIDYIYCGQIDSSAWFPEPTVPALWS